MKIFVAAAALAAPAMAAIPASVMKLVDEKINPCDDFYQYACGSWLAANPLDPSEVSKDYSFSSVSDKNELVIQDIVKEDWPLIGEFWDSCLDEGKARETLGNKPLQAGLAEISKAKNVKEVLFAAGKLSRVGASFITGFDIAGDYKDAKSNVMYVGAADPVLNVGYLLDDETMEFLNPYYSKYINTVMTLSGFNPAVPKPANQGGGQGATSQPAPPTEWAKTIITIERALAKIQDKVLEQKGDDAYYIPTTIGSATDKYPLSIGSYFNGAGVLDKSLTSLSLSSKVVFSYYDYFDMTEAFLKETKLEDLKSYVAFLYVNNRVRYLNKEFYNAYFDFFAKLLNGQQVQSSAESICSYRVKQYFPDLIGKYYFMKMFDNERQENAELLTKLISNAMGDHIAKLDWLDDATRLEAAGKLSQVLSLIGQSKVKQSYPYSLGRDTYFANIDSILTSDYAKKMKKIGNPVNRDLWSISPAEVNAYYSPLENKMVFPAAILQAPFFDGKAHAAQNFGSIGAVVGHELTHGFDNSGRRFDGIGNMRRWWTESTDDAFKVRAKCMMDQYTSFNVTGENNKIIANVNGTLTIGENIADNGGFSLTWDAFHEYAKTPAYEAKDVTPLEAEKLLFLSFAQTWCGLSRDNAMLQQLATDPHSPGQWRANGVAMNSDHFGPTFGCDSGTPMNPKKKCQIW